MQKEIALLAILKTIMEQEERIGCLEVAKKLLLQTNNEFLQRWNLMRIHTRVKKQMLVDNLPNKLIEIVVEAGDATNKLWSKKLSEFTDIEEREECDWRN